ARFGEEARWRSGVPDNIAPRVARRKDRDRKRDRRKTEQLSHATSSPTAARSIAHRAAKVDDVQAEHKGQSWPRSSVRTGRRRAHRPGSTHRRQNLRNRETPSLAQNTCPSAEHVHVLACFSCSQLGHLTRRKPAQGQTKRHALPHVEEGHQEGIIMTER